MEEKTPQNNENGNTTVHPRVVKRSGVLLGFAALMFAVLLVRILLLQTVDYDRYQQKVLE